MDGQKVFFISFNVIVNKQSVKNTHFLRTMMNFFTKNLYCGVFAVANSEFRFKFQNSCSKMANSKWQIMEFKYN